MAKARNLRTASGQRPSGGEAWKTFGNLWKSLGLHAVHGPGKYLVSSFHVCFPYALIFLSGLAPSPVQYSLCFGLCLFRLRRSFRWNPQSFQMVDIIKRKIGSDTPRPLLLEASKGGTRVGRMKDPLYKDSYLRITPPTFILAFEAPDS